MTTHVEAAETRHRRGYGSGFSSRGAMVLLVLSLALAGWDLRGTSTVRMESDLHRIARVECDATTPAPQYTTFSQLFFVFAVCGPHRKPQEPIETRGGTSGLGNPQQAATARAAHAGQNTARKGPEFRVVFAKGREALNACKDEAAKRRFEMS